MNITSSKTKDFVPKISQLPFQYFYFYKQYWLDYTNHSVLQIDGSGRAYIPSQKTWGIDKTINSISKLMGSVISLHHLKIPIKKKVVTNATYKHNMSH